MAGALAPHLLSPNPLSSSSRLSPQGSPPNWSITVIDGVFAVTEKNNGQEEPWPLGESRWTHPLSSKPATRVVTFEGGVVTRVNTCAGDKWTQRFYMGANGQLCEEMFFHNKDPTIYYAFTFDKLGN